METILSTTGSHSKLYIIWLRVPARTSHECACILGIREIYTFCHVFVIISHSPVVFLLVIRVREGKIVQRYFNDYEMSQSYVIFCTHVNSIVEQVWLEKNSSKIFHIPFIIIIGETIGNDGHENWCKTINFSSSDCMCAVCLCERARSTVIPNKRLSDAYLCSCQPALHLTPSSTTSNINLIPLFISIIIMCISL